MARRIDGLACSRATAPERIQWMQAQVSSRAEIARQEVAAAVNERMMLLQQRQVALVAEIDSLAQQKISLLQQQLESIVAGTCPPAPPEDPDEQPDPDRFLLCADQVITFKFGEADFREKIASFGVVGEASSYASESFVSGPALGVLRVGVPSHVWIHAGDKDGVRRCDGGDSVVAQVSNPEAFETVAVEDCKDGRYKVFLVPLAAGGYTLDVFLGGQEGALEAVKGGPFNLEVKIPSNYKELGPDSEPEGKKKVGGDTAGELHLIGNLHHPSGIDFDHTGRFFFVADQSNHRIQAFSAEEHRALAAFGEKGNGPCELDAPGDIVAEAPRKHGDRSIRLYVTDLLNHRLQVLEFNTKTFAMRHLRSFGSRGDGDGEFQFPKGLSFTEEGHLFVCDSGNDRIQVFDVADDMRLVRKFGSKGTQDGQLDSPLDVAINCRGEVLVSQCHRIQVFDQLGIFLRSFGTKGRKEGEFDHPTNMAVNDENALFVCDQSNHRVQVLDASTGAPLHSWKASRKKQGAAEPEGDDEDAAEGEPQGGEDEKPLDWVGVGSPAGIAVNTHGMVLVSDYNNNALFAF